ncbi:MAG: tetratricopeptide repeat protein [Hungatella sp.]|nr:tetratricopeptide repeat protein [Hungatella sp.]
MRTGEERERNTGRAKRGGPAAKAFGWLAAVCLGTSLILSGCRDSEEERYNLRLQGIEQLRAGDCEEAIASFEQALHTGSKGLVGEFELDLLKYRAQAEYEAGDYEAAAYTYEILLEADQERREYRERACLLYAEAGQGDKAKEQYQKLYESGKDDPETARILLRLGQTLTEQNRSDEAMELYEQAVNDGIKNGEIYNRMGVCRLEAGDYDEAIRYLEQGIGTGDVTAMKSLMINQAAAYEKKLDFARALSILQQCAAAYGATPEIEKEIDFLKTR